jgi:hypothetical protein
MCLHDFDSFSRLFGVGLAPGVKKVGAMHRRSPVEKGMAADAPALIFLLCGKKGTNLFTHRVPASWQSIVIGRKRSITAIMHSMNLNLSQCPH